MLRRFTQRQQHDLDIATVGMGDQQRQRYQVQLSLRQKYQQQLEQLRRDSEQKGTYNTDNRPTFFAFAKGAGVMGEAGPEAILPLRRGADGKLGVVADIGGSGMAMFAPQYNIEINNDGTNGQIGPAALKVVYDLGKKAAADFMQQQARDGGRLSGAYR